MPSSICASSYNCNWYKFRRADHPSLLLFFHPGRPRPIAQGFHLRSPWYLDTHEFSYCSFPLLKSRVVTNVPVSYIAELHGTLKVNCEFGLQPTMLTVITALALPLVGISPSAIG